MPKSGRLTSPLKSFRLPIASWRPNEQEFKKFQDESRITYTVPARIEINGRHWYRLRAYDVKEQLLGECLLPQKYYPLWRRLVYGALLQEKMYEGWIERTSRLAGKMVAAVKREQLNLRNMAGVRLVQYLLCRRVVLEELTKLRFGNDEPIVHSLIEFGIRESRDWLFETFDNAKKDRAIYLHLDPTVPQNKKEFEKGYHSGLEILYPPEDDDWWDGNFSHFDFKTTFNEIVKSVPKTMAQKSFQPLKSVIEWRNENEPAEWHESNVAFFSETFMDFLEKEGVDPRDSPEAYITRYLELEDADLADKDVARGFSLELKILLGDSYDVERVGPIENFDLDRFLREFGYKPRHPEQELRQGLSEDAQKILRNFCEPGGLEVQEALEQLVEVLGPGSERICTKLLDDLALDPSGERRASWDAAIGEAIQGLKELKSGQGGDKGKQKGEGTGVSGGDVDMDEVSTAAAAEEGGENDGESNASGARDDVEMGEPGSSREKESTAAAGEGEEARNALETYVTQSSQLLS